MPLYDYQCPICGQRDRAFRKIVDRNLGPDCLGLHSPKLMEKVIVAPTVRGDYVGYDCPVTGKWVEGRRAHEENLKARGARVLEPGETDAYKRAVAREDAALERSISETVDETLSSWPSQKKEQLVSELAAGADVSYQRATTER